MKLARIKQSKLKRLRQSRRFFKKREQKMFEKKLFNVEKLERLKKLKKMTKIDITFAEFFFERAFIFQRSVARNFQLIDV